jgi:hypothetical protein
VNAYDEERLAELIAALPPAPEAWVQAAQELPRARAELDQIVARAAADGEYRQRLIDDLESAVRAEGIEPHPRTLALVRRRLAES